MTYRNFPDKPLTPRQQQLFDNAVAEFKASKRAEFLQKSVVATVGFLVLALICVFLLSGSGFFGSKTLTVWIVVKAWFIGALVAFPPWLFLTAHMLDGGYRRNEETGEEEMNIRYLHSVEIWKTNRKLGIDGLKRDFAAKVGTQGGCVFAVFMTVTVGFLVLMAFTSFWPFTSFVIGAGSVWFLLGWYVWFNPLEDMKKHYKIESDLEYRRGTREVVDMPIASGSGPIAPPLLMAPGDYLDGRITLHENGAYSIKNGPRFDQQGVCDGLDIMGVRITKKEPGEGNEILFEADGKSLRVRFTQTQWRQMVE